MDASIAEGLFLDRIGRGANGLMRMGGVLMLIGAAALLSPMVSGLVATLYVGWMLIFSGAASLYGAFAVRGVGPFFGALLLGLLSLACGGFILARPIGGELAITLCLGGVFLAQGAFETALAFAVRPAPGWSWMLVSALASIALSVVILIAWSGLSLVVLGAVIGVNFLSSGLAFLAVGAAAKARM
jgi:uncharacterized membrane protein HdeD (DUF308 family)